MTQQPLELILLRQWASHVSLPVFVTDAQGHLIYYNEPAATLLGRPYDQDGDLTVDMLADAFQTVDSDGRPLPSEGLPISIALKEERPAHMRFRYQALDGVDRLVEVTAFPVQGHGSGLLGAVAVFWESRQE